MIASDSPATPVSVERLGKRFGDDGNRVDALKDVTFSVPQGDMLAVIGASGSGKSTLLHLIAGLTPPTEGRVTVAGQDLSTMSDQQLTIFRRRHIGLVFQSFNLIPALTAEDNLRVPLLLAGQGADRDRVEQMLTALELTDRRKHRPDQLSGGEQQRIAIGRALIGNPNVILADEPTGNLDFASRQKLCELMHRLSAEQNKTLITVTHDPAVAIWAKRIMVIKDGRILRELGTSSYHSAAELAADFHELMAEGERATPCP